MGIHQTTRIVRTDNTEVKAPLWPHLLLFPPPRIPPKLSRLTVRTSPPGISQPLCSAKGVQWLENASRSARLRPDGQALAIFIAGGLIRFWAAYPNRPQGRKVKPSFCRDRRNPNQSTCQALTIPGFWTPPFPAGVTFFLNFTALGQPPSIRLCRLQATARGGVNGVD